MCSAWIKLICWYVIHVIDFHLSSFKNISECVFLFPFQVPSSCIFLLLVDAQTQKPIKHRESERSFQDFLAKNQQWRK